MSSSQHGSFVSASGVLDGQLHLAGRIAARLKRRYAWIGMDDLRGYALYGLVVAAEHYQVERGVPFAVYALQKATYGAIDEMRTDGVIRRREAAARPKVFHLVEERADGELSRIDPIDKRAIRESNRLEQRDLCTALLSGLSGRDRRLILMYYADELTFREIGEILEVSEATVCLRHKAILSRLRRMMAQRQAS